MGTRAVVTFKDQYNTFSAYQHYDGYYAGIINSLINTFEYSWDMPRFDPADIAAAFIAANKNTGGGGFYMSKGPEDHGDLSHDYEVTMAKNGQVIIRAFDYRWNGEESERVEKFYGRLKDFVKEHGWEEDKARWNKKFPSLNELTV